MAKIELVNSGGYDVHLVPVINSHIQDPTTELILDTDTATPGSETNFYFVNNDPLNKSDDTLYKMGGNFSAWFYDSLHSRIQLSISPVMKAYNNGSETVLFYGSKSTKTGDYVRENIATTGPQAYKIYYHSDYTPPTTTHNVNKTLSNCTGNIPDTIEDGSQFTWTLTPNEGYEFLDGSVTSSIGTVSITSTGATITGTATADITVNATATAIPVIVTHTVTKTLTNCTGEIPSTIQDGSQFTWTLTPNEGYEFKEGSVTSSIGTVSITSTGATITGTATTDIMIQATATEKETPKETVNITAGNIQNCSYVPATANHGDTVTITITSDSDYAFTTQAPYIEYVGPLSQIENHKFTLNSDKTIGTISLDTNDIKKTNDTYTVTVTGTATYQQGTTVSEMYTVYSVSPSDLQAVSNRRFVNVSGSDYYIEQLITYINDLYRLPLAFHDLPTQALMLKNETIVNNAHVIPNVTYTYDMGTITLPKKYDNSNDYNNVYDVMLPYYGVYTLDNAKALDTPINIKAVIDIISGSCTYIFSRDGHAIDSVKTNIKENLPYMTRDLQQVGSLTTVTQFEVEPSITCYYHDITNAYVNKDVNDTVSNLTYFKADNIIHCNGISNKYKNLILNKLREGVFTNEL